jgi:hypothetical protein
VNEQLLLALIKIGSEAYTAIQQIRANDPAAYDRVSQHVADSLERAKAEALKP